MIVHEIGMYWTTSNQVVKVQKSKESGFFYGKALKFEKDLEGKASCKFEFAPGILKFIERKMTLDEAIQLGKEFGFCCVCGRLLTNKKSVLLAIGPICRGYF
jgi:hypothetical protein